MTHRKITTIDGGSAEYWRQRKEAYRLIREAEQAGQAMKDAPMYRYGIGLNEYGDPVIEENLGPSEDFDNAIHRLQENETAVAILAAQDRTDICGVWLSKVEQKIIADTLPYDDEYLVWVEPYGFIGPNTD